MRDEPRKCLAMRRIKSNYPPAIESRVAAESAKATEAVPMTDNLRRTSSGSSIGSSTRSIVSAGSSGSVIGCIKQQQLEQQHRLVSSVPATSIGINNIATTNTNSGTFAYSDTLLTNFVRNYQAKITLQQQQQQQQQQPQLSITALLQLLNGTASVVQPPPPLPSPVPQPQPQQTTDLSNAIILLAMSAAEIMKGHMGSINNNSNNNGGVASLKY